MCAELNIPVLIHTADPSQFFEPIDYHNERWLELNIFPKKMYYQNALKVAPGLPQTGW